MNKHTDIPFHEHHDDKLLTLDEVAEILKTSPYNLRRRRQEGTRPEFFTIDKRLNTTVADLRSQPKRRRHAR